METKLTSLESENLEYQKSISDLRNEKEEVCFLVYIYSSVVNVKKFVSYHIQIEKACFRNIIVLKCFDKY